MREKSRSYKDLLVWQKSHKLVLEVYEMTKKFPKEEVFGLTSQIRRAAVLVPANIAECFARKGIKDKNRFYNMAAGSLNEVGYYLILSKNLGYILHSGLFDKVDEIAKMLKSYSKTLENNPAKY